MMEIERVITGTLDENCYILKKDGKCLLIDPGSDSDKIKKSMGDNKLVGILVTHSHFDHVGALRDFLKSNRKLMVYKKSNLNDLEELSYLIEKGSLCDRINMTEVGRIMKRKYDRFQLFSFSVLYHG